MGQLLGVKLRGCCSLLELFNFLKIRFFGDLLALPLLGSCSRTTLLGSVLCVLIILVIFIGGRFLLIILKVCTIDFIVICGFDLFFIVADFFRLF